MPKNKKTKSRILDSFSSANPPECGQPRPGWDEYFIGIAKAVSTRATCLRRKYGAVITKNNIIVSTGYNGAPAGMKDCLEVGKCTRKELQIPHGERYELCHSVHAEANAIIRAAVHELEGATIYVSGSDDCAEECLSEPCMMCKRIILNSKIARVVYSDGNGKFHVINPKSWLKKRV
ncbi:MAG: dCMP deaminase family protein [Thermodesulfovibrionales bacterium]|nr:dCMP deaminase family protein [Thermodesulfovibrionales bacterium]